MAVGRSAVSLDLTAEATLERVKARSTHSRARAPGSADCSSSAPSSSSAAATASTPCLSRVLQTSTARGARGFCPGGSRRNLDWVRTALDLGPGVREADLLLLADAQTSGGLLLVGEVPGGTVIGRTIPRAGADSEIRLR